MSLAPSLGLELVALAAFAFLVAGAVKGVIGFGLPPVAMGVMGLAFAPVEAVTLLILPSLATNLWQATGGPALGALLARFRMMFAGMLVATIAGVGLLSGGNVTLTVGLLGAVLAAYAVAGLLSWRWIIAPEHQGTWAVPVGIATGAITGATGVSALPIAPYLQALDLPRDHMLQALGMTFMVTTIGLAIGLGVHGGADQRLFLPSLACLASALLGMRIGQAVRGKLPLEVFRKAFYAGLGLLGASMIARAVWG